MQADLTARKPILEINIPGLNFSDVASTSDDTGTYFYIAWIPELISALYKFGIAIVSIVAVVVIIVQGLRIVTSGGGEAKASAYKKILQSVIGLVIAWGSYAILYTVNPALVQFNALKVKIVERQDLSAVYEEPPIVDVSTAIIGNVPYFAQGDKRWGKKKPGDPDWPNSVGQGKTCDTVVARACGTTALAMVLKFYGKNVDPLVTAAYGLGCKGAWNRRDNIKNWANSPWSDLKIKSLGINEGLSMAMSGKPMIFGCKPCVGLTGEGKIKSYSAHYMVLTGSPDGGKTFAINDPGNSPPRGIVLMTRDQILRPTLSEYRQGTAEKYWNSPSIKLSPDGMTYSDTPNSMTYIYP